MASVLLDPRQKRDFMASGDSLAPICLGSKTGAKSPHCTGEYT